MEPTAPPQDRFVKVPLGAQASAIVEKKWTRSIFLDPEGSRLAVRGIEWDKQLALMMLTSRGIGVPEYRRRGDVEPTYADFERFVFGHQIPSSLHLPTVSLIQSILNNRLEPGVFTPGGMASLRSFASVSSGLDKQTSFRSHLLCHGQFGCRLLFIKSITSLLYFVLEAPSVS